MMDCVSCKNNQLRYIGSLPALKLNSDGKPTFESSLYECLNCNLYFRWPRPSGDILQNFYHSKAGGGTTEERQDWKFIKEWLSEKNVEKTILDIGCDTGEFLYSLDGNWEKWGVELNEEARKTAKSRGISILCNSFSEIAKRSEQFGVIVATDMIEHVEDPLAFFKIAMERLVPGGFLCLASGNPLSFPFSFMGSYYWYYISLGHISFVSGNWYKKVSKKFGIPIVHMKSFSHGDTQNPLTLLGDTFKNILFKISPGLFGFLREFGFGGIDIRQNPELKHYPPNWRSSKDHLLVIFQKNCE